jgi:cytochrome c
MKYSFWILFVLFFTSCKNEPTPKQPLYPETQTELSDLELGKKLFNGQGQCLACHKPTQKVIGPSVQEIVSVYEKNQANMIEFLKGNAEPIVDPSQYPVMKANLEITKKMTQQELEAIVAYMKSLTTK